MVRTLKSILGRISRTRVIKGLYLRLHAIEQRDAKAAERQVREQSTKMWQEGNRLESLELLRSSTASGAVSSNTWYIYGARLLEIGRGDAAYEAIKNANELNPTHLDALELLLEMYRKRHESNSLVQAAIDRLAENATGVTARGALDFIIPSPRRGYLLRLLEKDVDPVVRNVICIDKNETMGGARSCSDNLEPRARDDQKLAETIYALGRGRVKVASALLDEMEPDELPKRAIRLAARRALNGYKFGAAHLLLEQYLRVAPHDTWAREKYTATRTSIRTDRQLQREGFLMPPMSGSRSYTVEPNRVIYTVYNSLPYHSAGYATRTQGLLTHLNQKGMDVRALTRLGYPYDTEGNRHLQSIPARQRIGGVEYLRHDTTRRVVSRKPLDYYVKAYADGIIRTARSVRPSIIHGASNYVNGLASVLAARQLGIPSIYEVRGLWEVTRASRDPEWGASIEYEFMVQMETEAALAADKVLTITGALRDELIRRGVPRDKMVVVPNGVDLDRFRPRERDEPLAQRLGIRGKTVIGYVGSLVDYEGLDLLLHASAILRKQGHDFTVLFVGDGPERNRLGVLTRSLGLEERVKFIGRVPHTQVESYYSLIDICPFPRKPLPVSEMVSPLKPFEAMAMGKAIVVSDVAAMAEFINSGVNGRLHKKGDADSLADVLRDLLNEPDLVFRMGTSARDWVAKERSWTNLAEQVRVIYMEMMGEERRVRDL